MGKDKAQNKNKPKKIKFNVDVAKRIKAEKKSKKKPVEMPEVELVGLKGGKNKANKVEGSKTGRGSDKYNDEKIQKRIAKDKEIILRELEKSFGIVTNAIGKARVSNTTFYKWYNEDKEFTKAVDEIQNGFDVIVEDKLKQKIIQNDGHSIRFYLSHRVKKYRPNVGIGQAEDLEPIELIIERYKPDDDYKKSKK